MLLEDDKNWAEMLSKMAKVYEKCIDDESKRLFKARLDYLVKRDYHSYTDVVLKENHEWIIPQIDAHCKEEKPNAIIIWGISRESSYINKLIGKSKYRDCARYYCDNNFKIWGEKKDGLTIISPDEVTNEHIDDLIIIGPSAIYMNVLVQLGNMLFPTKNVIIPEGIYGHHLYGVSGWQYFDYWKPNKNEVFVDVGSLNGQTTVEFAKWCKGEYDGAYVFEANTNMVDICKQTLERSEIKNVTFFSKAAWNKKEVLRFQADEGMYPGGSRIDDVAGNIEVEADTIDNCLNGEKVTFIKMDIEGSEFKALQGARDTIEKYKPRLAISLYHKPEDIVEIPYIINDIRDDYKFGIRQYASNMQETVLYAI